MIGDRRFDSLCGVGAYVANWTRVFFTCKKVRILNYFS